MLRWFTTLSHFTILQLGFNALIPFDVVNGEKVTLTSPTTGVNVKRRQDNEQDVADMYEPGKPGQNLHLTHRPQNPAQNQAEQAAKRYTTKKKNTKKYDRTPPERITTEEQCDLLANYCLKSYKTGRVCGKTIFQKYVTFKSYCMLDYVNCIERYEMWQLVHMGHCYQIKLVTEYIHIEYQDDFFLDRDYVNDDQAF